MKYKNPYPCPIEYDYLAVDPSVVIQDLNSLNDTDYHNFKMHVEYTLKFCKLANDDYIRLCYIHNRMK